MATQIGRYVKISTELESVYGNNSTVLAVDKFQPIRVKSISYPVDRGLLQEENIDYFIPTASWGGALKVTGSLEGYLRPKQMEVLFYAMMGASAALSGSDPITSGYKYTMSLPLPMQMKVGESTSAATTDLELTYLGVAIKNCTLNFAQKDFATAKFDWFAKIYGAPSAYSPPAQTDYLTEGPILFYNATVSLSLSATTPLLTTKSMTLSIDRATDEERFILGDYTLQELSITGMTKVSGDMTFTEKEYAQFHLALFGAATGTTALDAGNIVSNQQLLVMITSAGASRYHKMYIKLGNITFGTTDTTITGNNEIEKKVTFVATGPTMEIGIGATA